MTNRRLVVTVTTVAALLLGGCSGASEPETEPSRAPEPTPESRTALEDMELAFVGSPTQAEIQAKLDISLGQFGLEPTEDNYRRAGSVLVALRQNAVANGCLACTEMAILDYMIASYVPGVTTGEWHEWAALSSAFLAAKTPP